MSAETKPYVLAFNSSPRKDKGITDMVLRKFLAGSAGARCTPPSFFPLALAGPRSQPGGRTARFRISSRAGGGGERDKRGDQSGL